METLDRDRLAEIRNQKIGFIFQSFNLLPRSTALDNVALPLVYAGASRSERREAAQRALERVQLGNRSDHRPDQLSGGQRQRVAVARALVTEPACVLADEPTGNLDRENAARVFDLILELNSRHAAAFVMVTHDPALAARMGRQLHITDGRIEAAT